MHNINICIYGNNYICVHIYVCVYIYVYIYHTYEYNKQEETFMRSMIIPKDVLSY